LPDRITQLNIVCPKTSEAALHEAHEAALHHHLHDRPAALERILAAAGPVDAVLLGGDLTNFGTPADARRLVEQAQAGGAPVLAVAGNCDSAEIEGELVALGVSLHGRGVVLGGVGIHGLSAIPPWRRGMYQMTEEQLAAALQAGYAQITAAARHVVVAHAPPRNGRLDRTFLLRHVGSQALREFIERTRPGLVICGHIHEARGVEQLGRTTVVNCGPAASGYFAAAEVAEEVKVELRRA